MVEIMNAPGGLLVVKVVGVLKKSELDTAQTSAVETVQRDGKLRVLVIAQDFRGWDREGDWGDGVFPREYDRYVDKIAIVAEKKWAHKTLAFVGRGLRPVPVEFFSPSEFDRARACVGWTH